MTYTEFRKNFAEYPLFSLNDIYKTEPDFDRRRLVEWQDKNHLVKLANAYYTFQEQKIYEPFLFLASNKIYQPSYISLESALAYYRFIPEGVFTITAVSTNKTQLFSSEAGQFKYRNLKEELFFGYQLQPVANTHFKIALPEKALLDFFYFNKRTNTSEEFEQMRLNKFTIKKNITFKRLQIFSKQFKNKKIMEQTNSFIQYLCDA